MKLDARTRIRMAGELKVLAEGGFPMKARVGESVLILPGPGGLEPSGPAVVCQVQEFWDERHDQQVRALQVFDDENPGADVDGEARWNMQLAHDYGAPFRLEPDMQRSLKPLETIRIPDPFDLLAFLRNSIPGSPEILVLDEGILVRVGKDKHLIRQEGKEPIVVPLISAAAEYMKGILKKAEGEKAKVAQAQTSSFPDTDADASPEDGDEGEAPEVIEPKQQKARFSRNG